MRTLNEIWKQLSDAGFETDKGSYHSYIDVYEKLLAPYRETAKNVLEIGLFKGNSLRMWEQYFTTANVHGIDCEEQPHGGMADLRPMIAEGTHNIHILDGTSEEKIEKEFENTKWDIVIDDSNHITESQLRSFEIFKTRMADGGLYIIEDPQNLEEDKERYLAMHENVEIVDLRENKQRYDDALILIRL